MHQTQLSDYSVGGTNKAPWCLVMNTETEKEDKYGWMVHLLWQKSTHKLIAPKSRFLFVYYNIVTCISWNKFNFFLAVTSGHKNVVNLDKVY